MAIPTNGSDHVSPVSDAQDPSTKLTHVGARTNGLPTGTAGVESLVTRQLPTCQDVIAVVGFGCTGESADAGEAQ